MKTVLINVEQRHIDEAVRWYYNRPILVTIAENCPIARAASEALGYPVTVGGSHIYKIPSGIISRLPQEIIEYNNEWFLATGWPNLKPFSFSIEIPE